MACKRGKAKPNSRTKFRLFAASGGYCQNPECLVKLFDELPLGGPIHIAEMAHIAAANDDGPRAIPGLTPEERGAFENLILLCANCHTRVDKAPEDYTDSRIQEWKADHESRLENAFGIARYASREDARQALIPLTQENELIFVRFGPIGDGHDDPESELARTWEHKVVTTILPNLTRILLILRENTVLLKEDEMLVLAELKQHFDDLTRRHTGENPHLGGSQYPAGMSSILE